MFSQHSAILRLAQCRDERVLSNRRLAYPVERSKECRIETGCTEPPSGKAVMRFQSYSRRGRGCILTGLAVGGQAFRGDSSGGRPNQSSNVVGGRVIDVLTGQRVPRPQ